MLIVKLKYFWRGRIHSVVILNVIMYLGILCILGTYVYISYADSDVLLIFFYKITIEQYK